MKYKFESGTVFRLDRISIGVRPGPRLMQVVDSIESDDDRGVVRVRYLIKHNDNSFGQLDEPFYVYAGDIVVI